MQYIGIILTFARQLKFPVAGKEIEYMYDVLKIKIE